MSFKAVWITRLLNCDPTIHRWAQVANLYYKPFLESNSSLIFNFDDSVHFPDLGNLSQFYKEVLTAFNNTFTTDIESFKENITEQYIWGNKFCVSERETTNVFCFSETGLDQVLTGLETSGLLMED